MRFLLLAVAAFVVAVCTKLNEFKKFINDENFIRAYETVKPLLKSTKDCESFSFNHNLLSQAVYQTTAYNYKDFLSILKYAFKICRDPEVLEMYIGVKILWNAIDDDFKGKVYLYSSINPNSFDGELFLLHYTLHFRQSFKTLEQRIHRLINHKKRVDSFKSDYKREIYCHLLLSTMGIRDNLHDPNGLGILIKAYRQECKNIDLVVAFEHLYFDDDVSASVASFRNFSENFRQYSCGSLALNTSLLKSFPSKEFDIFAAQSIVLLLYRNTIDTLGTEFFKDHAIQAINQIIASVHLGGEFAKSILLNLFVLAPFPVYESYFSYLLESIGEDFGDYFDDQYVKPEAPQHTKMLLNIEPDLSRFFSRLLLALPTEFKRKKQYVCGCMCALIQNDCVFIPGKIGIEAVEDFKGSVKFLLSEITSFVYNPTPANVLHFYLDGLPLALLSGDKELVNEYKNNVEEYLFIRPSATGSLVLEFLNMVDQLFSGDQVEDLFLKVVNVSEDILKLHKSILQRIKYLSKSNSYNSKIDISVCRLLQQLVVHTFALEETFDYIETRAVFTREMSTFLSISHRGRMVENELELETCTQSLFDLAKQSLMSSYCYATAHQWYSIREKSYHGLSMLRGSSALKFSNIRTIFASNEFLKVPMQTGMTDLERYILSTNMIHHIMRMQYESHPQISIMEYGSYDEDLDLDYERTFEKVMQVIPAELRDSIQFLFLLVYYRANDYPRFSSIYEKYRGKNYFTCFMENILKAKRNNRVDLLECFKNYKGEYTPMFIEQLETVLEITTEHTEVVIPKDVPIDEKWRKHANVKVESMPVLQSVELKGLNEKEVSVIIVKPTSEIVIRKKTVFISLPMMQNSYLQTFFVGNIHTLVHDTAALKPVMITGTLNTIYRVKYGGFRVFFTVEYSEDEQRFVILGIRHGGEQAYAQSYKQHLDSLAESTESAQFIYCEKID
jgi:hypothetical protein